MGFFSKKSTSINTSTTENFDQKQAADAGAIVVRNGAVSITDGGAFDLAEVVTSDAFDLAEGVAALGADFAFDALGFVQKNNTETSELLGQVLEQQREESAQLGSQILRLGIPAAAILGLILIMKGKG